MSKKSYVDVFYPVIRWNIDKPYPLDHELHLHINSHCFSFCNLHSEPLGRGKKCEPLDLSTDYREVKHPFNVSVREDTTEDKRPLIGFGVVLGPEILWWKLQNADILVHHKNLFDMTSSFQEFFTLATNASSVTFKFYLTWCN